MVTLEVNKEHRACRVYYLHWDAKQIRTTIKHYTFPVKDVRLVSLDTILGSVTMASGNGCITLWKNFDNVRRLHSFTYFS